MTDPPDPRTSSKWRTRALYLVVPTTAIIVLTVAFHFGADLTASTIHAGSKGAGTPAAINTREVLWRLLIAIAVIVVAARLVGALFRGIGQPQVVGEIVAGIVLGPSVLGALFPSLSEHLFTGDVMPFIDILAQLGLVVFMFLVGLEFDPRLLKGRGEAAALISHMSIVIPFMSGVLLALFIFTDLGSAAGDFAPFALFLGASMSITAFPVLARILTEHGLHRTRLGATTITCAAIDDVTAWCILAVVVAVAAANGLGSAFVTIGWAMVFAVVMMVVVRPFLARLATYHEDHGRLGPTLLALIFAGLLLSAVATDQIGIHAIFGAFLWGAVMPHRAEFVEELTAKLVDFTLIFLLPLFFAYSGLRTEIGLLGADGKLWLYCLVILVVAIAGKWGGSTFAARWVGMNWREATAVGVLMNCRGLTELVILNIGLDLGVIPPVLFAMLVIMALVTTFMTSPALSAVLPRRLIEEMAARDTGQKEETAVEWEILVHLPNLDRAYELVHTALSLARDQQQRVRVVLLRTLQFENDLSGGALTPTAGTDRAMRTLRPIVEFVKGAGYDAVPVVVRTDSVGDTIVGVAAERQPDLVLMTWRRPLFGSGLLRGAVGEVLRRAPTDVAVLIDPAGRGTSPRRGAEILVPHGGGYHDDVGLEFALRLARTHGANVHLLGSADTGRAEALASMAARAYERSHVWTSATSAPGDLADAVVDGARDADLVVLGVGDAWAADANSLGELQDAIAARTGTPLLLVRHRAEPEVAAPARRRRAEPQPSEHVPQAG